MVMSAWWHIDGEKIALSHTPQQLPTSVLTLMRWPTGRTIERLTCSNPAISSILLWVSSAWSPLNHIWPSNRASVRWRGNQESYGTNSVIASLRIYLNSRILEAQTLSTLLQWLLCRLLGGERVTFEWNHSSDRFLPLGTIKQGTRTWPFPWRLQCNSKLSWRSP